MKKGKTWSSLFIEKAILSKMPAGSSTFPTPMPRLSTRPTFWKTGQPKRTFDTDLGINQILG